METCETCYYFEANQSMVINTSQGTVYFDSNCYVSPEIIISVSSDRRACRFYKAKE